MNMSNSNSWHNDPIVSSQLWKIEDVNIQDALDGIYKRCIEMGANALVNFNATTEEQDYSWIKNPVKIKGYRITGFAIKIK